MLPLVQPGMVLLPRAGGSHPHVVLSGPFGPEQQVLVVNWTTLDSECIDDACVLQAGDHPLIRHPSAMAYSRAHLWRKEKILFAIANDSLAELAPLAQSVLQRVIEGGRRSPELRKEWKTILPKI